MSGAPGRHRQCHWEGCSTAPPARVRSTRLQVAAPLVVGVIWRETFAPVGAEPFDLPALARQHVDTLLDGLLLEGGRA